MAKYGCKGTVLLQSVSSSYVAVAQVLSIDISGEESETFDSTSLDGGVYKTYAPTGFTEPGDISGELFYDPALTSHTNLTGLAAAPVATNFKVTYADAAPTSIISSCVGFGFDKKIAINDGLKMSFKLKRSGAPT